MKDFILWNPSLEETTSTASLSNRVIPGPSGTIGSVSSNALATDEYFTHILLTPIPTLIQNTNTE